MGSILSRAGCFVAIILMGFLLRKTGFFRKEDFYLLSKIVIRITLTCAIITNFAGRELDYTLLILTAFGFLLGVIQIGTAWLVNRPRGRDAQAFAMLNGAGVNIGNFILPFAQGFLGPAGVMAASLFDVGNSVICLGGAYAVADMVRQGTGRFSLRPLVKTLVRSVPLITYIVMTILGALRVNLPAPVLEFAGIVGNANAFLAMLMLGVGFSLSARREQLLDVLRVLGPRWALGLAFAVLSWLFLPFPVETRKALVILFFGPAASAAPAFTARMEGDYGLASAINSISILFSLGVTVAFLILAG